jgi:DNA-binding ferritin-like protein
MSRPAPELIARCFAARTAAHFAHLSTNSHAVHMALESFYEDIIPVTDEFAEVYQGVFGKIEDYPAIKPLATNPVQMIRALRDWIVMNREECCEAHDEDAEDAEQGEGDDPDCSELANLIDNILAVIDRALYKLKFLK